MCQRQAEAVFSYTHTHTICSGSHAMCIQETETRHRAQPDAPQAQPPASPYQQHGQLPSMQAAQAHPTIRSQSPAEQAKLLQQQVNKSLSRSVSPAEGFVIAPTQHASFSSARSSQSPREAAALLLQPASRSGSRSMSPLLQPEASPVSKAQPPPRDAPVLQQEPTDRAGAGNLVGKGIDPRHQQLGAPPSIPSSASAGLPHNGTADAAQGQAAQSHLQSPHQPASAASQLPRTHVSASQQPHKPVHEAPATHRLGMHRQSPDPPTASGRHPSPQLTAAQQQSGRSAGLAADAMTQARASASQQGGDPLAQLWALQQQAGGGLMQQPWMQQRANLGDLYTSSSLHAQEAALPCNTSSLLQQTQQEKFSWLSGMHGQCMSCLPRPCDYPCLPFPSCFPCPPAMFQ